MVVVRSGSGGQTEALPIHREGSISELDGYARACRNMGAGYRGLLAGHAAAYDVEFQAGVLGGFYSAADGFAYEAGDLDAALFYVQHYGAAGGEFGFGRGLGLAGFGCFCGCSCQWLDDCRLDHVRCGFGGRVRRWFGLDCSWGLWRFGERAGYFCGFKGLAGMVGSFVRQVFVSYLGFRQQQLMLRRQGQIVRDVQVFENLLGNAMEYGGGNLSALVGTDG